MAGNPYHDAKGRFTSAGGCGIGFDQESIDQMKEEIWEEFKENRFEPSDDVYYNDNYGMGGPYYATETDSDALWEEEDAFENEYEGYVKDEVQNYFDTYEIEMNTHISKLGVDAMEDYEFGDNCDKVEAARGKAKEEAWKCLNEAEFLEGDLSDNIDDMFEYDEQMNMRKKRLVSRMTKNQCFRYAMKEETLYDEEGRYQSTLEPHALKRIERLGWKDKYEEFKKNGKR